MTEKLIKEAFGENPDLFHFAIHQVAETAGGCPWDDDVEYDYIDSALDLEYFFNRSGSKFCSPLVIHLLGTSETLSSESVVKIAQILCGKYLRNWNRLWATMAAEYNPIHNYSMTEERDLETTEDKVRDLDATKTRDGSITTTYGKSETTTHGRTTSELDSVYAFNAGVNQQRPTDQYDTSEGGTTGVADSGSDVEADDITDTEDTTETQDNEGTEHETIHRYGNIGVTTTQKMIEDDRRIWLWNYFEQVFKDVDRELTLPIYDGCRV